MTSQKQFTMVEQLVRVHCCPTVYSLIVLIFYFVKTILTSLFEGLFLIVFNRYEQLNASIKMI